VPGLGKAGQHAGILPLLHLRRRRTRPVQPGPSPSTAPT
jgi:hypothetical protein